MPSASRKPARVIGESVDRVSRPRARRAPPETASRRRRASSVPRSSRKPARSRSSTRTRVLRRELRHELGRRGRMVAELRRRAGRVGLAVTALDVQQLQRRPAPTGSRGSSSPSGMSRVERRGARPLGEPPADRGALPRATRARRTTRPRCSAARRGPARARPARAARAPAAPHRSPARRPRADDRLRVATLEQLEPLRRSNARGGAGSSTVPPPDGRLGAQDDAVAAGCDDRLAQPQLRDSGPRARRVRATSLVPMWTVSAAGTRLEPSSATSSRQLTG